MAAATVIADRPSAVPPYHWRHRNHWRRDLVAIQGDPATILTVVQDRPALALGEPCGNRWGDDAGERPLPSQCPADRAGERPDDRSSHRRADRPATSLCRTVVGVRIRRWRGVDIPTKIEGRPDRETTGDAENTA